VRVQWSVWAVSQQWQWVGSRYVVGNLPELVIRLLSYLLLVGPWLSVCDLPCFIALCLYCNFDSLQRRLSPDPFFLSANIINSSFYHPKKTNNEFPCRLHCGFPYCWVNLMVPAPSPESTFPFCALSVTRTWLFLTTK